MKTPTRQTNERLRQQAGATSVANYEFMRLASSIGKILAWILLGYGGLRLVMDLFEVIGFFSFGGVLNALLIPILCGVGAIFLFALTEVFRWMEAQDYNIRTVIRRIEETSEV